jgi:hypothetical protein
MEKEDELLEIDDNFGLNKVRSIENKFDYLLRENDLLYESKLKFETFYIFSGNYYKIKILPANKDFDSQTYFEHNFAKGKGREKLDKFKKENNVGVITY